MFRRSRRSRRHLSDSELLLLIAALLAVPARISDVWLMYAACAVILLLAAVLIIYAYRTWERSRRNIHLASLAEVDVMNGLEFEEYVAELLDRHGYRNISLTEPIDYGVDIIAERNGERWGVQTKRYAGPVSEYAVKQVVAGLKVYRCDRAMVITNSVYTSRAIKLAKSNQCVLVGRVELGRLINSVAKNSGQDGRETTSNYVSSDKSSNPGFRTHSNDSSSSQRTASALACSEASGNWSRRTSSA